MKKTWIIIYKTCVFVILFAIFFTSCSPKTANNSIKHEQSEEAVKLYGAGSTFASNLYHEYFNTLHQKLGIQFEYRENGSIGGLVQLIEKNVNFAATEVPMQIEQMQKAGSTILHIPTGIGAVAIAYHLEGVVSLNLDAYVLANIFMGNIRRWSDEAIKELNPEINLPDKDILVIHRFDRSGTAYAFSDFLSRNNAEWEKLLGASASLNWPIGINAEGNQGMADAIKNTPNSIGFLSLGHATQNQLTIASIRNKKGNYIAPSVRTITYATEDINIPQDTLFSLVNAENDLAYPICTINWMVVYRDQAEGLASPADAKQLFQVLHWIISEGQSINEIHFFAPLSEEMIKKAKHLLNSLTYEGNPIKK